MSEFFNEKVLQDVKSKSSIIYDYKNLSFNFKKKEDYHYFYCEINSERLNGAEIKELLNLNDTEKILSKDEATILGYVVHKITETQSYYKILNDFDLFFNNFKNTKYKTFMGENEIKFNDSEYKLDMRISFNYENNIMLNIQNEGDFILALDKVFFIDNFNIYKLSEDLPIKFYKELIDKKEIFTIDSFFTLKDTYFVKLKKTHNIEIEDGIEDLADLNIEEKISPLVLEVDKTAHFIAIELKYKVGNERFRIENYMYAETQGWIGKEKLIKIAKEDGKLIKYIADENLSDGIFEDLFEGTRISPRRYIKAPFRLTLPIFHLDNFINRGIPKIEEKIEVDYKGGKKINLQTGVVSFDIEAMLKSKNNLFEFTLKFKIGEEYFDLDFIKELMLQNKKFVQLKNGSTIDVTNIREINKWLEFLKYLPLKKSESKYQGNTQTALELDKFIEDFVSKKIISNQEYKDLIQELRERKPVTPIEIPEVVVNILREYQKEGVYWLHFLKKYGFGGILADEMGLGKTIQALTILAMEKGTTNIVICPKTLLYNWENEVNKYFPEMKVCVIDGDNEKRKKLIQGTKNFDIVITSYSMLQKDYEEYQDIEFNYAVLDEAHYVKNIKTLSAKAVRTINTQNKLLLTGTPLENNLDELYGTFDLVMPWFLGSKADFSKDFVSKIERNNMIALELLQAKIRPFILRRRKKDVLKELPDKQEKIAYSEMTNKQVGIYNEVLNRVRFEVNELVQKQGFDKSRIQVLSALLKLRQICNHPSLVDKSFEDEKDISGKHEQFLELLTEVVDNGEKVLVFSQFTSMLDIFEKDLKNEGIEYLRLDGSTKNRQELVDKFNNDDTIKVFLISLKAGGVGLNLTSASSVFLYDPWWNPMVEKQAQDRAHRIGQKKVVSVYKFITKNSIEEKILKLQEAKGNLFDNIVQKEDGFIKRLEWEDLMELFD
ncbi:MAG: DEAD/DEAH box helicase [Candidatus Woesearchaeota archaeon]|jgi:superfamily II DNA or RNA helicase|nr:DEAD/DEAH box helicase [Candidatus Woesearchaeota archaeon]